MWWLFAQNSFGTHFLLNSGLKTAAISSNKITRQYNLTVGARWMNLGEIRLPIRTACWNKAVADRCVPDGGVWRGILVCNGETPCPTLLAEEGDIVELNVHNDLFAQVSIHWSGMSHRT